MKIINKYTKFGFSGILLMIGLFIASFVLLYAADVAVMLLKEKNIIRQFKYEDYYRLDIQGSNNLEYETEQQIVDSIISASDKMKCNVSFDNAFNDINNLIEQYDMHLILHSQEYPDLKTQEGKKIVFPVTECNNALIAGVSIAGMCDDQRNISVNDIQVPVKYVLKDEYSSGIDFSMYMFWENCDDNMKQSLKEKLCDRLGEGHLIIKLSGNSSIDESFKSLEDSLKDYPVRLTYFNTKQNENSYQSAWDKFLNFLFLPSCILFSVFTCFSISWLWLSKRKKEIVIRKAYGYSGSQIFYMLFKDILFFSIPPVFLSVFTSLVYRLIINDPPSFDIYLLYKLLIICLGMILIVCLSALNTFSRINKMNLSKEIKSDI